MGEGVGKGVGEGGERSGAPGMGEAGGEPTVFEEGEAATFLDCRSETLRNAVGSVSVSQSGQ